MSRINFEDFWFSDPRRFALADLVGSRQLADGIALEAWRISQEYWAQERRLVPVKIFSLISHSDKLFTVGLASLSEDPDFVYVAGSRQYHEWRMLRQEAGKKGGLKTQGNFSSKLKQTQANSSLFSATAASSAQNKYKCESENEKTHILNSEDLKQALSEWQITLVHFGYVKDPRMDEVELARLILKLGPDLLMCALRGMRYEQKTENFDPASQLSLHRLNKKSNVDKFANLGSRANPKKEFVPVDIKL